MWSSMDSILSPPQIETNINPKHRIYSVPDNLPESNVINQIQKVKQSKLSRRKKQAAINHIVNNATSKYAEEGLPAPTIQSPLYLNTCEKAATLLGNGNTVSGTAALCGIGRKTLEFWMKEDHFNALVEGEKSRLREELLERIRKASEGRPHLWASSAWYLERNKAFGDEFKLNKDDQGRGNVVVQIAISHPAMQPQVEVIEGEVNED